MIADVPAVQAPPSAASVFGPARQSAVAYAGILATRGVQQGLLGPRGCPGSGTGTC